MGKIRLTTDQRELAANAVSKALDLAGDSGAPIGDIKNLITSTLRLGAFPKSDFGKILFTAKTKRVGMRYYAMTAGPKKEKKEKLARPETSEQRGDTYTDLSEVILKDGAKTVRYKKPKMVIVIPIALLISVGLIGAHLLFKI